MAIQPTTRIHAVYEVEEHLPTMRAFLLGAVRAWTMNRPNEMFALRNLVGGENWDWDGTPLMALFEKHSHKGKDNEQAMNDAAKDAEWILKAVLADDNRVYQVAQSGLTNGYMLLQEAQSES